ncbi:MAG: helix-turn-helix transcriptional regulator [Duncaniella sp.]|nr:helix-turn-helix transcriptional regulator [Duncaniella sp.]
MKFGDILRQKREERRMTQTDLAERIGTTQQNINSYETGYKVPPLRVVVAAADVFRCSTDEMIGRRIS